eukprot:scaffold214409_cov33-Tisochrysis_lutea.AAC.3
MKRSLLPVGQRWRCSTSKGEEIVSLAAESRLRMYTSFCFSTAPIITWRIIKGSNRARWQNKQAPSE